MSKLVWDKTDERIFETGVNKGVLYPFNTQTKQYDNGVNRKCDKCYFFHRSADNDTVPPVIQKAS